MKNEEKVIEPKTEIDGYFIFNSYFEPLQWTLSYVIPNKVYFEGLVKLQSRIIIALAVIILLSIDVIFIIAFRISTPLENLSGVIKDMIGSNYNTPLKSVSRNDEIGELYGNFETMRQKVQMLTTTDALTGVMNREFFMVSLDKEISRIKRTGGELCCLMIDIDDFKRINDTWGHQCGDKVLSELGGLMISTTRKYDIPARYGGEEFVIALHGINIEAAYLAAERLREKTQDLKINYKTKEIRITISIGISCFINIVSDTPELMIKRADEAMYEAKNTGKNKTVIYESHFQKA